MSALSRFISADWKTGVVVAEAGLTLAELIRVALPHGWFLPVSPGTKFVTLGGAVANDVHGKNHHVMGTFGRYVRRLNLWRSDAGNVEISPERKPELFAATVGGLGLTGIILSVELQLRQIASSDLEQTTYRFENLDEYFTLAAHHEAANEYAVAWLDCLATGKRLGRGHYIVANHSGSGRLQALENRGIKMPIDPPFSLVNSISLRMLNAAYYHRQFRKRVSQRVDYETYFYPLDKIREWNRIYGRAGFQQYQCVVPGKQGSAVIRELLQIIAASGMGSFLVVLKSCGAQVSPGLLSFPMEGPSLALDFPQKEPATQQLFAKLDQIVHEAGGRLYPAKDAHMSSIHFQQAYAHWPKVEALRDPKLMSKFWQRVTK
jgi:FAD/FMN-containing dehydrogenase